MLREPKHMRRRTYVRDLSDHPMTRSPDPREPALSEAEGDLTSACTTDATLSNHDREGHGFSRADTDL